MVGDRRIGVLRHPPEPAAAAKKRLLLASDNNGRDSRFPTGRGRGRRGRAHPASIEQSTTVDRVGQFQEEEVANKLVATRDN